ncbi:MAG TPA: dihydrolipoyl dehydrogenase [Longimicrobiales bacterium]|nr:dihydrolipoyl dehydrogenase [Longimicrobiales bacterium]
MADNFDLIVIGAGPGGYVAAIRGAQLGLSVACVEAGGPAGGLGGVCNVIGCIPTKAMLESAKYAKKMGGLAEYGIDVGDVTLDIGRAAARAKKIAETGSRGVASLFKKNRIELVTGWGRLGGGGKVEVESKDGKRSLSGKHIIIATGSRPRDLPILEFDGKRVWSSDQAVFPTTLPASIGIIGAGAIGMEFADVYNAFGSKVTVIEALDQVLPLEDADCASVVEKSYRKRGIDMYTSARLEKANVGKGNVRLHVKGKGKDGKVVEIVVDVVLVAIGRAPIIDDIGLDKAGVKTDRGAIVVDDMLQTTARNVYAIGDCAKPPLLAHKASHEGIAVVEHIAGAGHGMVDYGNIPSVTYCHPEVASVGLTEKAAKEKGLDIQVGSFPFMANGRARAAGETEGFVKIIRDRKYSEIVGAHIVGAGASELIAEFVVGRHLESTVEEMEQAMHPHPTLSEAVAEAALAALGRVIHI